MKTLVKTSSKSNKGVSLEGSCRITPVAPYDLSAAIGFYASRSTSRELEYVKSQGAAERLLFHAVINDRPVLIDVAETGDVDTSKLKVSWRELFWSKDTKRTNHNSKSAPLRSGDIKDHLKRVLSLEVSLDLFYKKLAAVKHLRQLPRELLGLKPALTATVFDAALWAIVGQQVTLGFALTLKERLSERYGRRFVCDGSEICAAPAADAIAQASVAELRELQLSQRKAEYLLTLSQAVVDGDLDLAALRGESYEVGCEKLVALRGIGNWTANYIMMRGAGHLDALPLGDAGLRRAVRSAYNLDHAPSDEEISERAEVFRPFRSLYTFYLWRAFA